MKVNQLIEVVFNNCVWVLDHVAKVKSEILLQSLELLLLFFKEEDKVFVKEEAARFVSDINLKAFWKLVFLTLRMKNDVLKEKIHEVFKILTKDMTSHFNKSLNGMILDIIKRQNNSLYLEINPDISDDARMNHLQTLLEYLSLTKNKIFLDTSTSKEILALPLTPTLWSLALNIIPR